MHSLREFDDLITAPHFGYRDAADYYYRASALRVLGSIGVPTLIVTAQDDPVVPYASFRHPDLVHTAKITCLAPPCGGHCAFLSRYSGDERFWAEARVVEFCRERSEIVEGLKSGVES